ncbi:MAG: ECF transporter S component [Dehalobacterium sp.]
MNSSKIKLLVNSALMAAIVVVGTMAIRIPTPTKGYIHIGDSVVYLCGILLGPLYGAVAAGLGSLLADLLAGFVIYAPVSLVIKGLDAMVVGFVYLIFAKHHFSQGKKMVVFSMAVILGSLVMVLGYLVFESFLYGFPVAVLGVIPNITQGIAGGILLAPILFLLEKQHLLNQFGKQRK